MTSKAQTAFRFTSHLAFPEIVLGQLLVCLNRLQTGVIRIFHAHHDAGLKRIPFLEQPLDTFGIRS